MYAYVETMQSCRRGGFPSNKFCDQSKAEFFKCLICFEVCRSPVTCQSGHLFCQDCLIKSLQTNRSCPACKEPLYNPLPSPFVTAQVAALDVLCMHDEYGCKWKGTCSRLDGHLDKDCLYEPIVCSEEGGCGALIPRGDMANHQQFVCLQNCPNSKPKQSQVTYYYHPSLSLQLQLGRQSVPYINNTSRHCSTVPVESDLDTCNARLSRKDLINHLKHECKLRTIRCPHPKCQVSTTYVRMPDHIEICPQAPMSCPLQCGAPNLTRESILTHKKECPNEPVPCAHAHLGYPHVAPRGQIAQHEQDIGVHFMGLSKAVAELQQYYLPRGR